MALEILNFVAMVSLIFMVIAISLYYLMGFIRGVGDEYRSWRNFKYWLERDYRLIEVDTRLIDLEHVVKEIKEKVEKNG